MVLSAEKHALKNQNIFGFMVKVFYARRLSICDL